MPEGKPEPKISLPEIIIVGTLIGFADFVELVLLFFGADDFWLSDIIAFPATQIYLKIKGVNAAYSLVANSLELIPWVGDLPLRTVGFIITLWIDRHPALEAVVAKGAELARPGAAAKTAGGAEGVGTKAIAEAGATRGVGEVGIQAATAEMGAEPAVSREAARVAGTETTGGPRAIGGTGRFTARETPDMGMSEGGVEPHGAPKEGGGLTEEEYFGQKSPLEKLKESLENLPETRKKEWGGVDIDDEKNQVHLPKVA